MKNTHKHTSAAFLVGSLFAVSAASAAVIDVPPYTVSPDGSANTIGSVTDVATPNGGNVLPTVPSGSTSVAYFVTTFTFGQSSDVHMRAHFVASLNLQQDRLGVEVEDSGLVKVFGGGAPPANAQVNLDTDLAGQTITILAKLHYDVDRNASNAADTLINLWINPDNTDVEGSGTTAGDMYHIWNSASFPGFLHEVSNQSTPGTAGDSSITTRIFTGDDATFANALNFATIPEPSTALLGALGMLALLRRRRA